MESIPTYQEIACQQVLVDDASVFSVQWSVFPTMIMEGFSPENLLARYLAFIRDGTISIIRPLVLKTGVEFRLLGTNLSLITFLPPEAVSDSVTLRICGGLLVQPDQSNCGRFRLGLDPVPGGVSVSLRLSEFYPLLLGGTSPSTFRYWLYRLTQAAIHRLLTVRFLVLLYRKMTGFSPEVRVVNISVCDGRPV